MFKKHIFFAFSVKTATSPVTLAIYLWKKKSMVARGFMKAVLIAASFIGNGHVYAGTGFAGPGQQNDWFSEAVLYLTGESDLENIAEDELERFADMARKPLRINCSSRSALLSSGLFSTYQAASLLDYRSRNGDVLSFAELASVDGFGRLFVDAVSHFVSLESSSPPGAKAGKPPVDITSDTNVSLKSREESGNQLSAWHRLHVARDGNFELGLAARKGYGQSLPRLSSYCGSLSVSGRRQRGRVVIGDYSLRFGQGIGLWSGFSISGFSGLGSFSKRPVGIAPSRSLSSGSSHRGMAADIDAGRFRISAFTSFPGLRDWCESGKPLSLSVLPGISVGWFSAFGTVSLTTFCVIPAKTQAGNGKLFARVSSDARFCIRGLDIFGEAAYDCMSGKAAATAGMSLPFADEWTMSLSGRWLPCGYNMDFSSPARAFSGGKGEAGVAAGVFYRKTSLTADLAFPEADAGRRQLKMLLDCPLALSRSLSLELRVSERLRSYGIRSRTDIRADLKWANEAWQSVFRCNVLECKDFSGLVYAEEGCSGRWGAVFLRSTFFIVDNWDDRIYSYERDAPGTFNVPAYYGRGYALSAVARLRFELRTGTMRLYFRTGFTSYPWTVRGSSGPVHSRLEVKLQLSVDF